MLKISDQPLFLMSLICCFKSNFNKSFKNTSWKNLEIVYCYISNKNLTWHSKAHYFQSQFFPSHQLSSLKNVQTSKPLFKHFWSLEKVVLYGWLCIDYIKESQFNSLVVSKWATYIEILCKYINNKLDSLKCL